MYAQKIGVNSHTCIVCAKWFLWKTLYRQAFPYMLKFFNNKVHCDGGYRWTGQEQKLIIINGKKNS